MVDRKTTKSAEGEKPTRRNTRDLFVVDALAGPMSLQEQKRRLQLKRVAVLSDTE